MKKYITLVLGMLLLVPAGFAMLTGSASAEPEAKVYVCKYITTPGEGEVLQTGNNPIEVSVNAIFPDFTGDPAELIGEDFVDGQERSVVIAVSAGPGGGQGDEPGIEDCPPPASPPTPTCPDDAEVNAGLPIPDGETEATFCFEEEPPPTCPEDAEVNAGLPIPDGQTAEEYCNVEDEQLVCPPGTVKAGQEIPEGLTAEEFCDVAGEQLTTCPDDAEINAGEVIPEGQTAKEFCNKDNQPPNPPDVAGEQETAPPEVAGVQQRAPMQPAAPATEVPTAVDAGL